MGVQCCLIDDDNQIVLVRHGYRPDWHFPGGGVEKNEALLTALERELDEEVGVTLTEPPKLIGMFSNFKHFPNDHIVLFVARYWEQTRQPRPNFEIAEIKHFAADALPQAIHPPTRVRLKEILENLPPAKYWQD